MCKILIKQIIWKSQVIYERNTTKKEVVLLVNIYGNKIPVVLGNSGGIHTKSDFVKEIQTL